MFKPLLTLLFLFPLCCIAQITITGKVLGKNDKKPIPNASVFLSNASVGAKSANDGTFKLTNVKSGHYSLVVSIVGYETFSKDIFAANADIVLPDMLIAPKTMQLQEVVISGNDNNRDRNIEWFKEQFLGRSDNASQCNILNPGVITLHYKESTKQLTASSDDFIEIENRALGYLVKYKLESFLWDADKEFLSYAGEVLFEPLEGSPSKQRRWEKNRLAAYQGSSMNFFRAAISNSLDKEGFKVFRVVRKPNPAFKHTPDKKYLSQTLFNPPLSVDDIVKHTDVKGQFALSYDGIIYVVYSDKKGSSLDKFMKGPSMPMPEGRYELPATIVTFSETYGFFDNNGTVINPTSLIFEGAWGFNRMAGLLPVDYDPK